MADMPKTREEVAARILELNEERDRLRQELNWVQKQIEAVQAVCNHPDTYFRCIMGRDDTNICKVCGKHGVPVVKLFR